LPGLSRAGPACAILPGSCFWSPTALPAVGISYEIGTGHLEIDRRLKRFEMIAKTAQLLQAFVHILPSTPWNQKPRQMARFSDFLFERSGGIKTHSASIFGRSARPVVHAVKHLAHPWPSDASMFCRLQSRYELGMVNAKNRHKLAPVSETTR
jgi:hypothetical protein